MNKPDRFCPLASRERGQPRFCEGRQCAWWDDVKEECVVKQVVEAVDLVRELVTLRREMVTMRREMMAQRRVK